jgi:hypothetical protein
MYVRDQLPGIPQVDMIVKTPEEPIEDALLRADKSGILWPRAFRSSAVAELEGYEGDFLTKIMDGYEEGHSKITNPLYVGIYSSKDLFVADVRETIEKIQKSPRWLKESDPKTHSHLPDDICVIIAEKSPSSIVGTYIKHPNQKEYYVISASVAESIGTYNPEHSTYVYSKKKGVQTFEGFSQKRVENSSSVSHIARKGIKSEIEAVIQWHNQIASLPEIDNSWTYQIEFGLDPPCLYQVRPFKPVEFADFELAGEEERSLVIGITPKSGMKLRVENDLRKRYYDDEAINSDNRPSVLYDDMREARYFEYLPNHQANILTRGLGVLAHDDIKAIRHARLTGIYLFAPSLERDLDRGDWVNIASDGKTLHIRKIKKQ